MNNKNATSVIIVGGSLVGLSAALFLSHWNVPVILLERHLGSSLHPRAIGYTARTIELLRSVGAEAKLPEAKWTGGPPRRIVVQSLAGKWQEEQAWTKPNGKGGKPPSFKGYSPVDGIAISQDFIEPVLRSCATELGAELRLGQQVTKWTQDESGVTVTSVDKQGKESTLQSDYLIACDGAHSPIRQSLGINRHGVGHVRGLRSILFRCKRIEEYLSHGYSQFQIEGREDGFEAFMTTYGDGRWMIAWHDETDPGMEEPAQRDLIRQATGLDLSDGEIDLITTGKWEIDGLIADTFSKGRIFLAGDASHALPPNRGGYGANTGISDVHNLAWKLSSVLKGTSRPELLETYDVERKSIAQVRHDQIFARSDHRRYVEDRDWPGKDCEVLDDVAMEFGQLYRSQGVLGAGDELPLAKSPEEWRGQPGTRAPHVVLLREGQEISTLDLFGKDWVVISEDESWKSHTEQAAQKTGVSCQFIHIGGKVAEKKEGEFVGLFGLEHTGASLIRPDGYIAWRTRDGGRDSGDELADALARVSCSVKSI